MLIQSCMAFGAAFGTVLLLGLQSKIMRDDRWAAAFFTSWGITLTQTATTYIIAHSELPIHWFVFMSGWGGSLGIVASHFLYNKLTRRPNGP